ncbi:androgen-dependent TFPI-regulating protein-like [Adelges cooleyi]|uniref:androgen-dependent TFPI-regulating protein-like n=1 Tax=Adelges cooleyi TaxID=133065 RepID=UPI00217FAE5B|nr:androgen-dependent TFPI-regulating protein-like [Adelges cooleyi]XP_050444356.1 androgen-dependent TFPI-regulating protein-like [Adelges cooleyi]XP_050444358.1 androgen-dependent TFPI-regulating protein-like [Adelges cooleyi]
MTLEKIASSRQPPTVFVRCVVHGVISFAYVYTFYTGVAVDFSVINLPTINKLEIYMKYMLTLWTLFMVTGFFIITTLLDFFEILPQPAFIKKLLYKCREIINLLFMSIVLPIAMCVSSGFWSAWMLNSKNIYPEEMNNYVPAWINHMAHTMPIFICLFELLFSFHKTPKLKHSLVCLLSFNTMYMLTLVTLRIRDGRWIYFIIDIYVNTIFKVIIMFSFLSYIIPVMYLIGCRKLNNNYWGIKNPSETVSKK